MKLSINDIKIIVNECVKKLSEARYIDAAQTRPRGVEKSSVWREDYGELKNKFINDIQNYLQWNVADLSDKGNQNQLTFFIEPKKGSNYDLDSMKRYLDLAYKFKKMTTKQSGNGLYVSFYVNPDSNYSPIGPHEKIRVFHGTDIKTAIKIAKNGLSGKEMANRSYSYEYGMNPNGLFVTTDFYTAKEFGYHYDDQVILEFTVDSNDLDTPVWNGQDTYFGQNTNPQPFLNRSERLGQKLRYQSDAENSELPFVAQSDNPAMAERIFNNNEHQALFYGDLMPNQIKRFWWKERGSNNYIPLSYKQFMAKFGNYSYQHVEDGRTSTKTIKKEKLYWPNESWGGPEDFVERMRKHELSNGRKWDKSNAQYFYELAKKWENMAWNDEDIDLSTFYQMQQILYPKQIIDIFGVDLYRKKFDKFYPEFRTPGNRV
jgi:hypothetical protein